MAQHVGFWFECFLKPIQHYYMKQIVPKHGSSQQYGMLGRLSSRIEMNEMK